jgi:hypothetical protein
MINPIFILSLSSFLELLEFLGDLLLDVLRDLYQADVLAELEDEVEVEARGEEGCQVDCDEVQPIVLKYVEERI